MYYPQEMTVACSCTSWCVPMAELVTLPSYHKGRQLKQSVLQMNSRDHLKDPAYLSEAVLAFHVGMASRITQSLCHASLFLHSI